MDRLEPPISNPDIIRFTQPNIIDPDIISPTQHDPGLFNRAPTRNPDLIDRAADLDIIDRGQWDGGPGPGLDIIQFSKPEVLPEVTSLHDYEFVKILGMGSYGLVCQYKSRGLDYALKFVLSGSTDHTTIRHEIEVLYWLNNYDISIPKIYTHGCVWGYDVAMSIPDLPIDHRIRSPRGTQHVVDPFQEYYVMVLEFIDGVDLSTYVQEHQIDDQSAYNITRWLYDLLAFLHEHSIVHRDIKPGNIVITEEQVLYLVDFGFACSHVHQQLKCSEHQVGTPVALAPEIWNGKINDRTLKKADVWAAGVTVFYVLNQDYPWRVTSYHDKQEYRQLLKEKILTVPAPDGRYIHPVTDVMKRSLTKDHLLRPSADRLCDYLTLYPISNTPTPTRSSPPAPNSRYV